MFEMTVSRPAADEPGAQLARSLELARADPSAFQTVYRQFFPRIYRYCLRRVARPEDAEDLTSQVFVRALSNLSGYRGGSFPAWLFRIAHNAVANHLRDRRSALSLEDVQDLTDHGEMLAGILDEEERKRVRGLVAALPEDARELIALRIAGGLSAREIGLVLGKSEGAVRVALHRIVKDLRTAWNMEQVQ